MAGPAGIERIVPSPMTVALVTNYIPAYRTPLYAVLAERLGVEVYCFGGEGSYVPASQRDLDRQLANAPFPAHRLEHQRDAFGLPGGHDAVIAAVTGRVALPAAYLGARRRRLPFVLWSSLWGHPRTAAHLLSFPLMRRIYRKADGVLTYGPHVSRYVERYRGMKGNVIVAPQAVEPELFGRAVSTAETAAWRADVGIGDSRLVLFVGRLVEEKGVDVLAGAWLRLGRSDARLCLVGEGEQDAWDSDVVFTGRMDRERLPVAYAAADIVVVPSIATPRFLEPWCLVCNEAMSQGCAVVASTAVGAAAGGLVRHDETGVVVPPGDATALAGALDRLLDDASLRARLGREAKAEVASYTYEAAADSFSRALAAAGLH
jgi:glycosyltransferase involved in cell wall biosynthesis